MGSEMCIRDRYIYNTKTQWAFKFDQVLPMDISQAQVFDRVGKHVVQNALDGYNSTVFAYGQTGSGKTFTITGGSERYEDRGIIPRALSMIFQEFRSRSDCSWSAHISYMEIYNEQGFDLLNESSGVKALQDLPRVRMMEDERDAARFLSVSELQDASRAWTGRRGHRDAVDTTARE